MTPILAYHKIDDRWEWGITNTGTGQFARQMDFLYKNRFRILTLNEVQQNSLEIANSNACAITFDDSYNSLNDNALPLLNKHGFKSTIFVITDYVGKKNKWDVNFFWRTFEHLNWRQLRELIRDGHEIGSHTATHRDLTLLDEKQIKHELERSKKTLEDGLGRAVDYISYPFGKTDDRVLKIAREAGYKAGFTMRQPKQVSQYAIARRGVYRIDTLSSFKRKVADPGHNFEDTKGSIINWFSQGTPVLRQVILNTHPLVPPLFSDENRGG